MAFTELNSVEHYIVHQLSGVDLNRGGPNEPLEAFDQAYGAKWRYQSADQLIRGVNEVLVESELKAALERLNPEIAARPELADEVIYKLRAILISVNQTGLVKANEEFFKWLSGEKTMPFGENNRHVPVRLVDFEDLSQNTYVVTNQFRIHHRETKIPDVVLLLNGIPVVVGEAKTPIRPSVSWLDGAHEIHNIYENSVPQLFVPNILSFATEGKELFYGAIRCPLEFWSPWRLNDDDEGAIAKSLGLAEVGVELSDLLSPARLLDILRNFSLFTTNKKKQRTKVIPRFQQLEGANQIVERVIDGRIKKGLIWHFQGSGKSLLMVFAAQKLRRAAALKSPTVIVLVDRTDLDTQISGTFNAADVANVECTENIAELQQMLERDTRKIIISMIHKFRDAKPNMNTRDNIIVLVDEAHRTQEGDLGRQMRAALPNAFLFGLTGTPVNKADKNTFWAFGAEEDQGGYMSRYTFHDSIRDGATLPLHFEPRLVDVHVDKEALDKAFAEFKEEAALSDEEADALNQKSAKMSAFLKAPERVEKIVKDIATHFAAKVAPHGLKALVVTPDRYACVQYKEELDKYFSPEASTVVISTSANDDFEFKKKWGVDKSKQEKITDEFNDATSELKFIIVTAKLLTGFDAPILQTMYLDKSMKDHTLVQAICRTNRLYPQKTFGRIVDYFGVFDDAAKALEFDEESVKKVITNLSELRNKLPQAMRDALAHFDGVDRSVEGFAGLEAAQNAINTDEKKDAFARDFKYLAKIWESLSPDPMLNLYNDDYKWLAQVYESVKPASNNIGKLLWLTLGAQTTQLIHDNIHVGDLHTLDEFVLDADVIEEIFNNPDPKKIKQLEKILLKRFKKHGDNPRFKSLSERLEALRDNGGTWQRAGGAETWEFRVYGLVSGTNSIAVRARDIAGNYGGSSEVSVVRLMNQAPVVQILSPEQNIEVVSSQNAVSVSGSAYDPDGSVQAIQFRLNGDTWKDVDGGTVTWSFVLDDLQEWDNVLEVRAQDNHFAWSAIQTNIIHRVPYNPSGSLIAQWHFDNSLADSSINGLDLLASRPISYDSSGWSGQALMCVPEELSVVSPTNDLVNVLPLSASLWMHFDSTANDQVLIGVSNSWSLVLHETGELAVHCNDTLYSSGVTVSTGSWHNVIIVWDTNSLGQIYLDGEPAVEIPDNPLDSTTGIIQIGSSFSGLLDEICFWSDSLSHGQVLAEYNKERGSVSGSVIGEGSVSGVGTYYSGTEITLEAIPDSGWVFKEWNDFDWNVLKSVVVTPAPQTYVAEFGRGGGLLSISTTLPDAVWNLTQTPDGYNGALSGTGSVYSVSAPSGNYSVSFEDYAGYTAPVNQSIFLDTGGNVTLSGIYLAQTSADTDGDGIPDSWESLYFAGATNGIASLDSDGDGRSNLDEYIAGTDPTNRNSRFTTQLTKEVSGGFTVTWNAVEGRIYDVLWTPSLDRGFIILTAGLNYPVDSYVDSRTTGGSCGFYKVVVRIPGAGDSDGDGLPDSWEMAYFSDSISANVNADTDKDGHSNIQEYIAGTIPTDAASVFAISQQLNTSEGVVITWVSVEGRTYSVLRSPNLSGTFELLKNGIEFPQNSYTDTVHNAESTGFYKVDVRMKP